MSGVVEYTHPNGYLARLYGKSSMTVMLDGKEVSHTNFRAANTKEEVMELLEIYPSIMQALADHKANKQKGGADK